MALPKIIVVVGPTASGKTDLGIALAREFDGEVVAVDSRTVYKGMDVGAAKPTFDQRTPSLDEGVLGYTSIHALFDGGSAKTVDGIPHWGFDLAEPDAPYSVSDFATYAHETIRGILKRGRVPVLVGGTGLWMQVVVDHLSLPQVPPNEALRSELQDQTTEALYARYKRLDPEGAEVIDRNNKRRLIRAIEVCEETGEPFSHQRKKGAPLYDALWLGLGRDLAVVRDRIDERVDRMVANGLVDEVRHLRETYGCGIPSMSGIGYREICAFLDGRDSLKEALEHVKTHTRQFAKRQITWFKRDERIRWVESKEEGIKQVQLFLK